MMEFITTAAGYAFIAAIWYSFGLYIGYCVWAKKAAARGRG